MLPKPIPRTDTPFTREVMASTLEVLVDYSQECMWMFLLNSTDLIVDNELLYIGTHNNVEVSARYVCRFALYQGADQVVLAHNHTDGSVIPSPYSTNSSFTFPVNGFIYFTKDL